MHATAVPAVPARPRGLALLFGWRRLRFTLILSGLLGLIIGHDWTTGPGSAVVRAVFLGLIAMVIFGLFEQWPKRLPRWLARWVLQVVSVGVAMPIWAALLFAWSTPPGA